jgi:two-component system, NtrC family, response regulator AtoC
MTEPPLPRTLGSATAGCTPPPIDSLPNKPGTVEGMRRALAAAGLAVEARQLGPLAAQLERRDLDVLLVPGDGLTHGDLRAIDAKREDPCAPSVLVVGPTFDALARATLLARGVSHVVEEHLGEAWLATALEAVARAETQNEGQADPAHLADFISRSAYMQRFVETVRKVLDADSTLLITGETGVGKERLARAIHAESRRGPRAFVAVNCAALPEALLESELFGHAKGAFTGATGTRSGLFDAAQGGTIFLDEIGEMPLHLQAKLLTVLERREVTPVGSTRAHAVDARVLAATNRDLGEEVSGGRFREDLFYRLNVIPLCVPPLRERREDIPDLVGSLLGWFRVHLSRPEVRRLSAPSLEALVRYDWPGNVRELANAVERAVLLCQGDCIELSDLPNEVQAASAPSPGGSGAQAQGAPLEDAGANHRRLPADWRERPLKELRQEAVDRFEAAYLNALLGEVAGDVQQAADRSGLAPRSLYDRLRRLGLRPGDFRS